MTDEARTPPPPGRGRSIVCWLAAAGLLLIAALCVEMAADLGTCTLAWDLYEYAAGEAVLAVLTLLGPRRGSILRALALFGLGFMVFSLSLPRLLTGVIPCNQATAIADLRALELAQRRYARENDGFYESRPACLFVPDDCQPSGSPPGREISEAVFPSSRRGYRRTFTPGPAPGPLPPGASPTGVTSWACAAVPEPGPGNGWRGYCIDSGGVFCYTDDGSAPPLTADGQCDLSSCTPMPPEE